MHKLVLEKAEEPEINMEHPLNHGERKRVPEIHHFSFIDYAKAFDCVDHNKLWKILKEMGIQDHLTCLLRNLYAGQQAKVRTGHGKTDQFQKLSRFSHVQLFTSVSITNSQSLLILMSIELVMPSNHLIL